MVAFVELVCKEQVPHQRIDTRSLGLRNVAERCADAAQPDGIGHNHRSLKTYTHTAKFDRGSVPEILWEAVGTFPHDLLVVRLVWASNQ